MGSSSSKPKHTKLTLFYWPINRSKENYHKDGHIKNPHPAQTTTTHRSSCTITQSISLTGTNNSMKNKAENNSSTRNAIRNTILAICIAFSIISYQGCSNRPDEKEIRDAIATKLKHTSIKLTTCNITPVNQPNQNANEYSASISTELTEPYYKKIKWAQFCTEHNLDLGVFKEIDIILHGEHGRKIAKIATLNQKPEDPTTKTLVQKTEDVGFIQTYETTIYAKPIKDGWSFDVGTLRASGKKAQGKPMSELSEAGETIIDDPVNKEGIIEKFQTAQIIRKSLQKANDTYRDTLIKEASSLWKPGAILSGAIKHNDTSTPLYIEVKDINQDDQTFTALIHNDGAWISARRFTGYFSIDADYIVTAKLHSPKTASLRDAGPVIEWGRDVDINLAISDENISTPNSDQITYTFHHTDKDKIEKIIKAKIQQIKDIIIATEQGKKWKVVEVIKESGERNVYTLTFTEQTEQGGSIVAVFQEPTQGWRREFKGRLAFDSYMNKDAPLLLGCRSRNEIDKAPSYSLMSRWFPSLEFALADGNLICTSGLDGANLTITPLQ